MTSSPDGLHGNCTIAPPQRRACETSDADRARLPSTLISSATGRSTHATDTDDTDGVIARR